MNPDIKETHGSFLLHILKNIDFQIKNCETSLSFLYQKDYTLYCVRNVLLSLHRALRIYGEMKAKLFRYLRPPVHH
jgi:hypothetical protein